MVGLLLGLLGENLGGYCLVVEAGIFRRGEPYVPDDEYCNRLEDECKGDFLPQSECFRFASHGVTPDANLI